MVPILRNFVLPHATTIAFLVAYGELAIGLALLLGVFVRPASVAGLIFMLTLLFSSDYSGPAAPLWQYFGASLSHSVFALFLRFSLAAPTISGQFRAGARTRAQASTFPSRNG